MTNKNEATNPENAAEIEASALNGLLCSIKASLEDGFMACNSAPNGSYTVEIEFKTLKQAQHLHRILCKLPAT